MGGVGGGREFNKQRKFFHSQLTHILVSYRLLFYSCELRAIKEQITQAPAHDKTGNKATNPQPVNYLSVCIVLPAKTSQRSTNCLMSLP